jgi:hypothetical protein
MPFIWQVSTSEYETIKPKGRTFHQEVTQFSEK